jgi:hypothetical protein
VDWLSCDGFGKLSLIQITGQLALVIHRTISHFSSSSQGDQQLFKGFNRFCNSKPPV